MSVLFLVSCSSPCPKEENSQDFSLQIATLCKSWGPEFHSNDNFWRMTALLNNSYITAVDKKQCVMEWFAIPQFRDLVESGYDGWCVEFFLQGYTEEEYKEFWQYVEEAENSYNMYL